MEIGQLDKSITQPLREVFPYFDFIKVKFSYSADAIDNNADDIDSHGNDEACGNDDGDHEDGGGGDDQ